MTTFFRHLKVRGLKCVHIYRNHMLLCFENCYNRVDWGGNLYGCVHVSYSAMPKFTLKTESLFVCSVFWLLCGRFPLARLCVSSKSKLSSWHPNSLKGDASDNECNRNKETTSNNTRAASLLSGRPVFWNVLWLLFGTKCGHLWARLYLCEVGTLPNVDVIVVFRGWMSPSVNVISFSGSFSLHWRRAD